MKKKISPLLAGVIVTTGAVVLYAAPLAARDTAQVQRPQSKRTVPPRPRITAPAGASLTMNPAAIMVNTPTTVTITAQFAASPLPIPNSVNLLRIGAPGAQPAIVGVMQAVGAGAYSWQGSFNETAPGQIVLQASAAYPGQLKRSLSTAASLPVWGVVSDATSGFSTAYPPTLYDLTTPAFGGYLLQSSPQGVVLGGEGPEDGSHATSSGYAIVISSAPYAGTFDINAWLSSAYPYSEVDSLTTTTVGGLPGFQVIFANEVGAGEPTAVVYNNGYVYKIAYASSFGVGSLRDVQGLSDFSAVLQHFAF